MATGKDSESSLHSEYRAEIEGEHLGEAIRNASLLFIVLQTVLFIPADRLLHPQHFESFLIARLLENAILAFVYFKWSRTNAVHATVFTAFTGSSLFLYMVHLTGGVESGYYVGLMLLLVGIAVIAPLSGRQSGLIAAGMVLSYASLPWTSHAGIDVAWPEYFLHLFFLGSASVEAAVACAMMDKMRFRDFRQKRELVVARDNLAEMDRAKTRFSANVHHELRTPLTLILSPLEALRSGEFGSIPNGIASTLDSMHSNGRRLHKMINNLLDLSKLESQQFRIVRRPTRIDRLVHEIVSSAKPMAERKGVSLSIHGLNDAKEIAVDPDAIEKVLINLIGNSLKFTQTGGAVRVTADEDNSGITLSVEDDGIGIPSDQLDAIFDRFAQVDSSTTRNFEGTGIGLSLAQEMVALHSGKIWAESDGEGHGATMKVWLPSGLTDIAIEEDVLADDNGRRMDISASMAAVEADLNLEIEAGEQTPEELSGIERQLDRVVDQGHESTAPSLSGNSDTLPEVLIAEDNPDMRRLLEKLISRHYRVRVARNGLDALNQIHECAPDLVLSDVMMPEMDGIELCRRVKVNPETSSIPVILVTSKAENEMKVEGLERGADDYVTKPFHPRELLARVGSLARSSMLRSELSLRNDQLATALTDLQAAEVKLVKSERLAAVGELTAGIAHEVNNPVNFALNAARMLSKNAADITRLVPRPTADSDSENTDSNLAELTEISDEISELAEIVSDGLERTHALVSDLKNIASSSASEVGLKTRVSVSECVASAAKLISPTLTQAGCRIEISTQTELPDVYADRGAIGQVLLNLLKNACDAMSPSGGGDITIDAHHAEGRVVLSIADDGPGIPEGDQSRVFEPFFTTKPAGEGTGLGLAVSRQIVEEHGGTIEFSISSSDRNTVTLDMPSADIVDEAIAPT